MNYLKGRNWKKGRRWERKLNGNDRHYCQDCLSHDCNSSLFINSIANRKRLERRRNGLCEACGQKKCVCKSNEHRKKWL